ncbi:MAG TPA: hypothetical protein VL172_22215 [Kofleriaceae bacterium]|jgi:hypothetical protein|nr:hypothetical protein [Kofleriaceae bacterium]
MRRASRATAALALAGLLAAGCSATDPAPARWRRTVAQAQRSPFGAWVNVELRRGPVISGELLAVEPERIFLGSRGQLRPLAIAAIAKVTVSAYAVDSSGVAMTSVLGGLSTLSHGWFLVLSLPVWTLLGIPLSRSASGQGFLAAGDPDAIRGLRKWARFPQGMPAGMALPRPPPPRPPVPEAPRGGDGQVCYQNLTCNAGLVCDRATAHCHPAPALGTDGGACYANGACEPGLICKEGTCAPSPPPP